MKAQFLSVPALLCCFALTTPAQAQQILSVTSSASATTASYDGIMEKLAAKNLTDYGWTFHAIGAGESGGLFSIGLFPTQADFDARLQKVRPVFEEAGFVLPVPQTFSVHRTFAAPLPADKPANGILVFFDIKGMSAGQYDQVVAGVQKSGLPPIPAGQLFHAAFVTPDGIKVIDIWESAEQFQAFGNTLMPVLQAAGVTPPPPTVYRLYNYLAPRH